MGSGACILDASSPSRLGLEGALAFSAKGIHEVKYYHHGMLN